VIVIGENPTTPLTKDWWSFWDDVSGFNLKKFEIEYEAERKLVGKRPLSNTRIRLRRLRDKGLNCLETNAFSNEGMGGFNAADSNAALLQLFLGGLPGLRGVIAHGAVAQNFLGNQSLPAHVQSYPMRHFRSESYEKIDAVADAILQTCKGGQERPVDAGSDRTETPVVIASGAKQSRAT